MINSIIFTIIAFLSLPVEYNFLDEQYDHYEGAGDAGGLLGWMTSNDLILVVLGVSLIVWFTLLAFLYRLDRKVTRLEQKHENKVHTH